MISSDPVSSNCCFVTTVIDLDQRQRTALRFGLNRGAVGGARCVGEALACVDDPVVVDLIEKMWESTPLFQLAVGMCPRPRFDEHELSSALTLIEFDVDLNLPSQVKEVYTDAERSYLSRLDLRYRGACRADQVELDFPG